MKKLTYLIVAIAVLGLLVSGCIPVVPPAEENELDKVKPSCATIQGGTIYSSTGELITTGYDKWGYNYQAHIFDGLYWNYSRPSIPWTKETLEAAGKSTTWLTMKWNDAWLSNKDCDVDGLLDRHYGFVSYSGSGAWCTNHQWGSYYIDNIVDVLDIGDVSNEIGHNLEGWSDHWVKPGWGGNYGGGSDDETLRLLMGPGDGCEGFEDAYFTMNTNGAVVDKLILHHLDGSQPDDFDVWILDYIDESLVEHYALIGNYASLGDNIESWVTSEYTFSPRSGELKFKLVATVPIYPWCENWGQVAFSWAKLESPCYWDYFVKIVAAPADAYVDGGVWYTADGIEIGPVIWGAFAVIQRVYNDPCAGEAGVYDLSPAGPGFGHFQHLSVKK